METEISDVDRNNAMVDDARPAVRAVALCLREDLVGEFEELERRRADAASRVSTDSLAGAGSEVREIAEAMEALRDRMKASTMIFKVQAMPRKAFRKLLAAHPPRRDEDGKVDPEDSYINANGNTMWEPLIRASIISPQLDPARLNRILDEILSDAQFEELAAMCWTVNRSAADIPFSLAASRILRPSEPKSELLEV